MNRKLRDSEHQPQGREIWLSADSLARLDPILRSAKQLTSTELEWLIGCLRAFQEQHSRCRAGLGCAIAGRRRDEPWDRA
jgi:hypothetical protein